MGLVTGGIFIVLGVFVLCVATFGIFRFEYALNRFMWLPNAIPWGACLYWPAL